MGSERNNPSTRGSLRGRVRVRGGSTRATLASLPPLEPEAAVVVPRGNSTRCGRVRVRGGSTRATLASLPPLEPEAAVVVPRGNSTRCGRVRVRGGSTRATLASLPPLEPEAAVVVPRGGSTRRDRVRVRGGSSRANVALGVGKGAVVVPRGGRDSDRPGPRTIEGLTVYDIEDMPAGQGLETPLHPSRKRQWQPSVSCVSEPSIESPRPCQSLRDKDIFNKLSYGSEPDSESDDEDFASPYIFSRAQRSVWDTPMDADDADQPTADPNPAPAAVATALVDASGILNVHPTATDQPWSLYDFDWKPFPDAPIPPESRREKFSHIDVGPTAPCVDPYDIFVGIWDRQFMEYIASETNRYAQQVAAGLLKSNNLHPNSRINRWRDTNVDELFVYFGIVIAMGVVVRSRVEEYWNVTPDVFCTPGFSAYMSISRFSLLSKCLHFVNNEDMCALRLESSEAKLFKVQPLLSHLNNKFQSMYRLGQNIALDESLLQWKGWLDINQLIPNKAASVGIKTYEICESQTGYLWRFEVHGHSKSPPQQLEDPLDAFTPAIVLRLTQGLEGKGHTLWMDNFYNSPCLARRLKVLGFDCVGTMRTNRKFVPQALHSLTKENMRPGQISGLTSGDVDVMVWRDNNRVAMISTYHGNAVSQIRDATKPILIQDYNIMMGGVDKKDQMLAMYPIERKRTRVWYKKLFRRLLNVSILNAHIIHRQSFASSSSSFPLSHRNFRMSLVRSLLSKHCSSTFKPATTKILRQSTNYDVSHRLAEYPFCNTQSNRKKQRLRRMCVMCARLMTTYCVGCSKTVCMDPCFLALHS